MSFRIYKFQSFLEYPEFAFKLAFFEPFIWSGNRHRHQPNACYYTKRFIFIFCTTTLIMQIFALIINLYMPHTTSEDELYGNSDARVFEAFALICYFTCGFYKMLNIFWRSDDIGRVMEEMKEMFPSAVAQKNRAETNANQISTKNCTNVNYRFAHYEENSRRLMRRLTKLFMFAYIYYNIIPILQLIYELLSPNQSVTYKAQSDAWYPWHNHNNHSTFCGFIFSFLIQASAEFASICFITCGEFLFCFFTTQLQFHFDYLSIALTSLHASAPDALVQLKTLINYHNHLMRLYKEINSIFNLTFMLDLIIATMAISLMGFAMVLIDFSRAIMFSAGLSFFLVISFVFCRNGDEFAKETNKLGAALFYSNWYEGNIQYQRMIIFFLMRLNRPCEYRAYGYTTLSMETYMRILKLSYQLFTSFRAIE